MAEPMTRDQALGGSTCPAFYVNRLLHEGHPPSCGCKGAGTLPPLPATEAVAWLAERVCPEEDSWWDNLEGHVMLWGDEERKTCDTCSGTGRKYPGLSQECSFQWRNNSLGKYHYGDPPALHPCFDGRVPLTFPDLLSYEGHLRAAAEAAGWWVTFDSDNAVEPDGIGWKVRLAKAGKRSFVRGAHRNLHTALLLAELQRQEEK